MENTDILERKLNQEKNKFKIDIEGWSIIQAGLSNELNEKMKEIISTKNNINLSDNPLYKLEHESDSSNNEIQKRNELQLEIDKLKYDYQSKLQQMKNMKNKLYKEKLLFETQTNDIRLKINKERNDLEKMQIDIEKKNNEIKIKKIELDKKEKELNEENDKCIEFQNLIKEKNNKNLKDEKDLENAEYKKNTFHNDLLDKKFELDNLENRLNQEIKNLEDDKLEIFNNKNEIEQLNREINLRMKCLNDLNDNNFINQFNNIKNDIYMKEKKEEIDSKFLDKNNYKEKNNINEIYKFDKFKKKSFNSELYLLQVKNRIDTNRIKLNGNYNLNNKKFDHEKEQQFLMKSYESLNKIKK